MSFLKSVLGLNSKTASVGIGTGSKDELFKKAIDDLNDNNNDLLELTRKIVIVNPQLSHLLASYVGSNRKAILKLRELLEPDNSSHPTKEERMIMDNDLLRGRVG